ncbi:rod shape-determining protein MreD [Spirochaeta dissipatitropha]
MARIIRNILGISIIVFINSTWFAVFPVKPDLVLILIVWLSLKQGPFPGEVSGFCIGFVEDILSLSPLGFHMTARTIIGLSLGSIREYIGVDRIVVPLSFTAAAYLLQSLWLIIIIRIFSIEVIHSPLFSMTAVYSFLLTVVTAPVVFLAADVISIKVMQLKDRII